MRKAKKKETTVAAVPAATSVMEVIAAREAAGVPIKDFRENLIFVLRWPEAKDYAVYGFEFDEGFRPHVYAEKGEDYKYKPVTYNLYHANTIVIVDSPMPFYHSTVHTRVLWTKQPWEVKKEKTEIFLPPYSNQWPRFDTCMGAGFAQIVDDLGKAKRDSTRAELCVACVNQVLYGAWTASVPDSAHSISDKHSAVGRYKQWQSYGKNALDHYNWDRGFADRKLKTMEGLFSAIHKTASDFVLTSR